MTDHDRSDDFERGLANRRAVLGDEWVDRSLSGATEFNADFQSLITRYAWNDIWGRPGLDHQTRRLLVLGMIRRHPGAYSALAGRVPLVEQPDQPGSGTNEGNASGWRGIGRGRGMMPLASRFW